jgi:hypothetical protein
LNDSSDISSDGSDLVCLTRQSALKNSYGKMGLSESDIGTFKATVTQEDKDKCAGTVTAGTSAASHVGSSWMNALFATLAALLVSVRASRI